MVAGPPGARPACAWEETAPEMCCLTMASTKVKVLQ